MNRRDAYRMFMAQRGRQSGAAVIEFAFVFPILLFMVYGLVVYAYIFVLQESVTFVAQQAAASALSVAPNSNAATARTQMTTIAVNTINQSLAWLGSAQLAARVTPNTTVTFCSQTVVATCPTDGGDAVVVTVRFSVTTPTTLFPVLSFGSGQIPPMPTQLSSTATVRI